MKIASSSALSDREKFEKLGLIGLDGAREILGPMFDDHDDRCADGRSPRRFIAEERDSLRMFRAVTSALHGRGEWQRRRRRPSQGDGRHRETPRPDRTAVDKICRALDGRAGNNAIIVVAFGNGSRL